MIPKIIHYCWFGRNPLPNFAKKCILSWKKYLPDYEIKEWNEDNFNVNMIPYTKEAYSENKYAFVSDYARFWILFHYGGLYFDTDVEVIRPLDDIISRGPFMGCEFEAKPEMTTLGVNPGLGLGVSPKLGLYKKMLDFYANQHFLLPDGSRNQQTIVKYTTDMLVLGGLRMVNEIQYVEELYVYPKEFFCPMSYESGKLVITNNTRTIHHYSASWLPWYVRAEKAIFYFLGLRYRDILNRYVYQKFLA